MLDHFEIHGEPTYNNTRHSLKRPTFFSVELTYRIVTEEILCMQDESTNEIQGFFGRKTGATKGK